ncbi:related to pisatin demethylase cytochrome P450 [Phialocephala subalpina]|uniref:Related to pisatin demethylase cytochrome P450 n=1 Tax=Phialocephala subalpina TaxID=576137 RepID=A0A1L7XHT3_9HELO|nr:related to pisatin demethylase cytochrome P450 [Phialocephala subalpina]
METDTSTLPTIIGFSALLGVASHLGYFIHGEHHLEAVRLAILLFTSPLCIFTFIIKFDPRSAAWSAARLTAIIVSPYLASLTTSILTYRVFFHPLRRFPGPLSAKLTKLAHVLRLLKKSDNYLQADRLHKKYGEIVRIGPNEVTIIIPDAVPLIYGPGSKCTKTAWYDVVGLPNKSLQLERDPAIHAKRRKVWDRAFNSKALKDYENRVVGHADQLVKQLQARSGEPVDGSLWMNFYAFDVMGDIAFGKTFDMLATGEKHHGLTALQDGMAPLGLATPFPWAIPIFQALPQPPGIDHWINFCDKQILARKKYNPEQSDIMTWLIEAENENPDPIVSDPRWLWGDTRLVIVAGSDTSSSAMTHIFYHLAKEPYIITKLREELATFYKPGSENEIRDLQDAKYLNGVINEALRLHPPVPSGVLRQTPPEGITVGDTFIPGGVTISAPSWSMGRLESCFKHAEEFLPERWVDNSELILNKGVFIPFASGAYSCIGKQLALMELRIVTARLVTGFDIAFAPGETGKGLLEETKDVFTMEVASLMLVFTRI